MCDVLSDFHALQATQHRQSVPIRGFWHVLANEVGCQIAGEQFDRLQTSGLLAATDRITIGKLGPQPLPFEHEKIAVHSDHDAARWEYFTLDLIYQDAFTVDECFYWYIHTKAASYAGNPVSPWRDKMERCVIDDHAWCRAQLAKPGITSCGPLLYFMPHPLYAGNFWWTKASHVRRLLPPRALLAQRMARGLRPDLERFIAEEWITQGIPGRSVHAELNEIRPYSFWRGVEYFHAA